MKTSGVITICALLSTFTIQVMAAAVAPAAALTAPAPVECICGGRLIPLFANMCVCGCKPVEDAMKLYDGECTAKPALEKLNQIIAAKCQKIENTEDCEEFKTYKEEVNGKKVTDLYKSCRDKLDSIQDDCENCTTGCTIPGAKKDD